MISQSLISFKIDNDLKSALDSTISELPVNRNKFINYCVRFGLDAIRLQLDIRKSKHLDCENLPFLSDLN